MQVEVPAGGQCSKILRFGVPSTLTHLTLAFPMHRWYLVLMPSYRTANELPHKGTLTLDEASLETGVSKQVLLSKIKSGELTAYQRYWRYGIYGRMAWFIPITALKAWMIERAAKHLLGNYGLKHKTDQPATPLA